MRIYIHSGFIKNIFSHEFFRSTIVHWTLIVLLLLNFTCWGLLLFFIRPVDFPLILHYNVYFGVDIIGDWRQIYLLPAIVTLIFIINTILGYFFYKQKERAVTYLLFLASFIAHISALIAIGSLIRINY
ncbi:MAG: hypothetical protein ACD_11C00103G0056 [uncultured bacterium]|nr:MAG: hypothetical protein ACD_11C00103G0056 [uncultured bacterium]HBR71206.1 hypothetical protein [Candidatus Moranbacteria bacterium]